MSDLTLLILCAVALALLVALGGVWEAVAVGAAVAIWWVVQHRWGRRE